MVDETVKEMAFDGVYDLTYAQEDGGVMFYDVKSEVYYLMPYQRFNAFIRSTFGDKAEQVLNSVYAFKQLRIIPREKIAAVKTPVVNDFEKLSLSVMFESVGAEFKDAEERRTYFIEKYGIKA